MPHVIPKQRDLYLCHKFKLNEEKPTYITQFHPKASKDIVHHILLYTCSETIQEDMWNCGEMSTNDGDQSLKSGPVCTKSQEIIYAWAMDAPELILPKDVAFKVGGNTNAKYIVLQVHYASIEKFLDGKNTDNSGVVLSGQYTPVDNLASVFLTATGGYIKSNHEDHFEAACEMKENVEIYPFAYRTHAHKLGLVNSGYVVKTDKDGKQEWIEIGRRSPQLPQMFYPVTNKISIGKGDIIATRCTMENTRDHTVYIGGTNEDEMCNFYIMYYVKGHKTLKTNVCYTSGPPFWYFKDYEGNDGSRLDLRVVPKDISEVPAEQEENMANDEHMNMSHQDSKQQEESKENSSSQESEEAASYVIPDELNDKLTELEKESYYEDLIRKYMKNRINRK